MRLSSSASVVVAVLLVAAPVVADVAALRREHLVRELDLAPPAQRPELLQE